MSQQISADQRAMDYLRAHSLRVPEVLLKLRERTAGLERARMQISAEQGQLMGLLVQLVAASRPAELGPPRFLEVGTFTGYSSTSVALAVPAATVLCCDVSDEWTSIARETWASAGVTERIELVLQPATQTLRERIDAGESDKYDFAFIDADKSNYLEYYERCLQLVRSGGLIAVDNVLWGGSVADPTVSDEDTEAIRALNKHIHADDRVDISMLPVGDGLTLARKV